MVYVASGTGVGAYLIQDFSFIYLGPVHLDGTVSSPISSIKQSDTDSKKISVHLEDLTTVYASKIDISINKSFDIPIGSSRTFSFKEIIRNIAGNDVYLITSLTDDPHTVQLGTLTNPLVATLVPYFYPYETEEKTADCFVTGLLTDFPKSASHDTISDVAKIYSNKVKTSESGKK